MPHQFALTVGDKYTQLVPEMRDRFFPHSMLVTQEGSLQGRALCFSFFPPSFFDGHSVDEKMGLSDWIKHFNPPHLTSKAICKGKVANAEMQTTWMPPSSCLKFPFSQLVPVASGHLPLASATSLLVVEVCS